MARATKLAREPKRAAGPRDAVLSVRIPAELKARMDRPAIGPYRVSISDLVLRGVELALTELEGLKGADMRCGKVEAAPQ